MAELTLLREGKTKQIFQDPDDSEKVFARAKDDITAGDGASHDVLTGKAVTATTTTCNVFELLDRNGIPTHYVDRVDERTFRALKVDMVPIELVVRRIATGSYLKRNPAAVEGEVFDSLVFELFHKDDPNHDPIMRLNDVVAVFDRYPAGQPIDVDHPMDNIPAGEMNVGDNPLETIIHLREISLRVFRVLEQAWAEQDVQLVDLKIECGWAADGRLVVADVVDNDSWRIWPAGDKKQMLDKQVYRNLAGVTDAKTKAKELGAIKRNYTDVAERTERFHDVPLAA